MSNPNERESLEEVSSFVYPLYCGKLRNARGEAGSVADLHSGPVGDTSSPGDSYLRVKGDEYQATILSYGNIVGYPNSEGIITYFTDYGYDPNEPEV